MAELNSDKIMELSQRACAVRKNVLRMIAEAKSGHPGGSLSAVDILTTLYFSVMNIDPVNPLNPDRDRFVLSKGHAAPALYAVLAERGFFFDEELLGLRKLGSRLQGHPDMKNIPGVDMSTGSLGQGISAAAGMALAAVLDKRNHHIYALLGDGELEEGQVWEAAMFAAHYKLTNLTVIIDHNGLQIDGPVAKVMSPLPIADKWEAFGWHVIEIDGHSIGEIYKATRQTVKDKPTAIVAHTVKGKGVRCMENVADWHGKAPTLEECQKFISELSD